MEGKGETEMNEKVNMIEDEEEEILEKTGPDKKHNERVFNYKIASEETREIEVRGIAFLVKFYKTTTGTAGIRVQLEDNGPIFQKFLEYCKENKGQRIEKETQANLMAFTTFGKLDQGLEFFPVMGFYIFPFGDKTTEPHLVFNEEKDAPEPMERLEAFMDYYKKKLGIKVRPKKSSFDSLRKLVLTEIGD